MPSPFPGMDPYLEGYLWPDCHQRLAGQICDLLTPQISPAYVARLNIYAVADQNPGEDVGIMYPDVDVLKRKVEEPAETYGSVVAPPLTPPSVSIPSIQPIEVRIPVVEIRDRQHNQLITAIEILSPVNKRRPGLQPYIEKRKRLHEAGVHLLEIDLIRRGQRPFTHPKLPEAQYMAMLMRASTGLTDVWAFNVQDVLPVLPVPLKPPAADVPLDLGKALKLIYERSMYHLSIDYSEVPPPPAFDEGSDKWIRLLITQFNKDAS